MILVYVCLNWSLKVNLEVVAPEPFAVRYIYTTLKIMTLMSRSTRKVILFCASHLTQLTPNHVQMIHPVAFCPYALHTLAKRAITIGPSSFLPQKVALMRKVTRYEYEKHHFPSDKEEEFQKHVRFFQLLLWKFINIPFICTYFVLGYDSY